MAFFLNVFFKHQGLDTRCNIARNISRKKISAFVLNIRPLRRLTVKYISLRCVDGYCVMKGCRSSSGSGFSNFCWMAGDINYITQTTFISAPLVLIAAFFLVKQLLGALYGLNVFDTVA